MAVNGSVHHPEQLLILVSEGFQSISAVNIGVTIIAIMVAILVVVDWNWSCWNLMSRSHQSALRTCSLHKPAGMA